MWLAGQGRDTGRDILLSGDFRRVLLASATFRHATRANGRAVRTPDRKAIADELTGDDR
jgi:hypothetical protein